MSQLTKLSSKKVLNREIRKNSFFQIAFIPLFATILIFFTSCSFFKIPKNNNKIDSNLNVDPTDLFINKIQGICLEGEGRGRFQFMQDANSFGFESKINMKKRTWSIALNFPLQGEKLVHLNWNKVPDGKVQILGPSMEKVFQELMSNGNKFDRKLIQKFIHDLGMFLYFYEKILSQEDSQAEKKKMPCLVSESIFNENGEALGKCQIISKPPYNVSWKMGSKDLWISFNAHRPGFPDHIFKVTASKSNNSHFRKIQFSLIPWDESSKSTKEQYIALDLFLSQCISP